MPGSGPGTGHIAVRAQDARVRVLQTPSDVAALRPLWASFAPANVGVDLDWFLMCCEHAPEVSRPHVLVVEDDGVPTGLAVGRVEVLRRPLRLGGRTVLSAGASRLVLLHDGVLGSAAGARAELVMQALWRAIGDGAADALVHRAPAGGPLHCAARRYDAFWQHSRMEEPVTRRRLVLPATFEQLMAARSSDSRSKLRRAEKRRRERLGDDVEVRCLRDPADLDRILETLEDVSARSSKHAERGFRADDHTRAMMRLGLERGWYRAWTLHAGGRAIAWCDGELYAGTFYTADGIGTTGYDAAPEFRDLSLGTAVMLGMFADLCADPACDVVDFGAGPWEYKRRWANETVDEVQPTVYAARPRAIAISLGRKAGTGASRLIARARNRRPAASRT